MRDIDLATAAVFLLRHEAEIARARLASAGIPAVVRADDEGGLSPGFFADHRIRLLVRREDAPAATALLEAPAADAFTGVTFRRDHVEAMIRHAGFTLPDEACGLLALDAEGDVRFVYCLTNALGSPHRFTIDAAGHYGALRHAEARGWEIAGAFHSHPEGPAYPSATDVAAAVAADWLHVIVGLADPGRPQIAAFAIRDGDVVELPIDVA
jgi:proteasome lid subunit RPN8/RPN11